MTLLHRRTVHVIAVAALLFAAPAARAYTDIEWFKDLKQAVQAAQERDLPIFVDFWADWCAACKIMDAEVYTDPAVIEIFRTKIIGLRVHFDMQQEMARRFGVPALPYLLFTNSHGTPLIRHRGFLEAEDLVKVVNALPPLAEINRLDHGLQEDRNHFPSLVAMARTLREVGFYETSNSFFDRALKRNEAKGPVQREAILYAMGMNWLELQDGKRAADVFERYAKEFPAHERRPEVLLALVRSYQLQENADKARRALQELTASYPDSAPAREAQAMLAP